MQQSTELTQQMITPPLTRPDKKSQVRWELVLPLAGCVILGKLLPFSVPHSTSSESKSHSVYLRALV